MDTKIDLIVKNLVDLIIGRKTRACFREINMKQTRGIKISLKKIVSEHVWKFYKYHVVNHLRLSAS